MLKYTEFGLSHIEVPGETSLCIYISGCHIKCKNCHYPELQSTDSGMILSHYFKDIISLYRSQASCVCFMGEGDLSKRSREELMSYIEFIKDSGLKACLFSGRDIEVEDWMLVFDYVKTGSYKEAFGPLSLYNRITNQRLLQIDNNGIQDITDRFWE